MIEAKPLPIIGTPIKINGKEIGTIRVYGIIDGVEHVEIDTYPGEEIPDKIYSYSIPYAEITHHD